ncbi:MAG: hydroxylamine oxidase [Deltaproteobacteria bacterium]|nr:hydroxylamine oxidase [Deltaproteobacteria bacterium]
MRKHPLCMLLLLTLLLVPASTPAEVRVSEATASCIECHSSIHPGIVEEWRKSRMSRVTPAAARDVKERERRVSFTGIPSELTEVVVGCAECHTGQSQDRKASFEHNGFRVHTVVSPRDCALCHPAEVEQYGQNLMSHAYGNLMQNAVYLDLARSVTGVQVLKEDRVTLRDPDPESMADSCLHCHGTRIGIRRMETRETDYGEMVFPVLSGWPNQGVGRINPDGSKGSCSACHTRHRFALEMARKPYTCAQCHKGPDVPAYKVYEVSKHGNLFNSLGKNWNFDAVPWRIGADLTAPTCATCHVSLLTSPEGEVLAERTHRMNDRLPWRIFGLVYAHPHPRSPDTSVIRNKAGLPLPTELTGEPAAGHLITNKERKERRGNMQKVCLSCHSEKWVQGHFARFEHAVKTTNEMTLTATGVLLSAYRQGAARGLSEKDSIFNEAIEKKWVEHWLFFANSTRYASAMMGADYGVFAKGRWSMSRNIQEMRDWLEFKLNGK